jgi:hypothetical protein
MTNDSIFSCGGLATKIIRIDNLLRISEIYVYVWDTYDMSNLTSAVGGTPHETGYGW